LGSSLIHKTAIVYPGVLIADDVWIGAYSVIGSKPEHREYYDGKETKGVVIKSGARIFSHVTIDAGTKETTVIGEGSAIFNHAHVAHDCHVGTNVTIGGGCSLAGHTVVMDGATISGHSCTHQRVVIGAYSFVGGMSLICRDVPPGEKYAGYNPRFVDRNEVGLSRAMMTYDECNEKYLKAYEELCRKNS
jgi:UDP-N-acetylglucosamine acyltransferase